ncbi:MAG TPA: L-fucose/L-arabinose isomerase family protein, partial [Methanocellaceae archaeon]
KSLEDTGEFDVITGEIIGDTDQAKSEAQKMKASGVEATVFNIPVWIFPSFPVIAANEAPGPYLLFSDLNPRYPGMVGMLATAGAFDMLGIQYGRAWGDIEDPSVLRKAVVFLRASTSVNRLKGETFGLFGGRPMGMYTAAADPALWQRRFGIDVEHTDQWEIVRRSPEIPSDKVDRALKWLESHVKRVLYDGRQLTPEKLKQQIRSYYVVRRIIEEKHLDFIGIKAQPELTDNFATMDLTEAFLNDPYDWDGPHEPIVAATEADMDGALTMQVLHHITGDPVLFADVRHYDADGAFFDLCNSGSQATYFAGRSRDPAVNLKNVELYPQGFYFPAGGASVRSIAAPGEVTIARFCRKKDGEYWLAIIPATFLDLGDEAEKKAEATQVEWPHAFARLRVPADDFLGSYGSNHCHAVYGDWSEELVWVARILGIDYTVFRAEK